MGFNSIKSILHYEYLRYLAAYYIVFPALSKNSYILNGE